MHWHLSSIAFFYIWLSRSESQNSVISPFYAKRIKIWIFCMNRFLDPLYNCLSHRFVRNKKYFRPVKKTTKFWGSLSFVNFQNHNFISLQKKLQLHNDVQIKPFLQCSLTSDTLQLLWYLEEASGGTCSMESYLISSSLLLTLRDNFVGSYIFWSQHKRRLRFSVDNVGYLTMFTISIFRYNEWSNVRVIR